jgi:hypothetical protein
MERLIILIAILGSFSAFATAFPLERNLIDLEKVTKISFLLASGRGVGPSIFGHAYLRFSYGDELSKEDIAIEFVADSPLSELSYIRGLGLSLKGNYDFAVIPAPYETVYKYHVLKEDRDLTSYVLNISPEEMRTISIAVNKMIVGGVKKTYSFITRNCASVINEIIEDSLGNRFNGPYAIYPSAIPIRLKEMNMISYEYVDLRVSNLRMNLVKERFKGIDLSELGLINIKSQLTNSDLSERIFAYYKLHHIRLNYPKKIEYRMSSLVRKLLLLESILVRKQILPLFNSRSLSFKVYDTPLVNLKYYEKSIKSTHFETRKGSVYLVAKLNISSYARNEANKRVFKAKIRLPGFKYKNGKLYDQEGIVVSYRLNDEINDPKFSSPSTYIKSEVIKVNNQRKVLFTLLRELEQETLENIIEDKDLLAIDNGYNGVGFCLSHSELTRMLKAQVIFAPKQEKITEPEYFDLLESLYNGKVIVIPGYAHTKEFTANFDHFKLAQLLIKRHTSRYSFYELAKDWFSDKSISNKNIYILKNLVELGANPIIYFKLEGKSIGHSVIVTKIVSFKDKHLFTVIDPNNTSKYNGTPNKVIADQYWFNKKTDKLHTFNYGNVNIKTQLVDFEFFSLLSLFMSDEQLVNLALNTAKEQRIFKYSISDFN